MAISLTPRNAISATSQDNHHEAKFSVAIARDILQYVAAQGVDLQDIYHSTKIEWVRPQYNTDIRKQVESHIG